MEVETGADSSVEAEPAVPSGVGVVGRAGLQVVPEGLNFPLKAVLPSVEASSAVMF